MFAFCCDTGPPDPPGPQEMLSARSKTSKSDRKKTVHHLHLSLNQDLMSTTTSESIPENELYLLGKEMPVFVKMKTRNRKKSYCTSSDSRNILACEELITSILENRVTKQELVLNVGYDNHQLILKLSQKAKMMVWVSEFCNYPAVKAPNLKKIKEVDSYNRLEVLSLFDSLDVKPIFTMNPQTQTIDYMIFQAFDKYINKSTLK